MRKHKKGFTIVELVIVIAVIGILSAILIPTFVGVTQNANKAALKSNLANAYSMYAADAADRVDDDTKAELQFVAQNKVWLCATQTAGEQGYVYETDKGWNVDETKVMPAGYDLVADKTYNGFYVFAEPEATENEDQTQGGDQAGEGNNQGDDTTTG